MRVDKLLPEFKDKLDDGSMTLVAAVALLYDKGEVKLDAKSAKAIRESAGNLTAKKVVKLFNGEGKKVSVSMNIKILAEVYQRFFPDISPNEAAGIVERTLEAWFGGKEAVAHI